MSLHRACCCGEQWDSWYDVGVPISLEAYHPNYDGTSGGQCACGSWGVDAASTYKERIFYAYINARCVGVGVCRESYPSLRVCDYAGTSLVLVISKPPQTPITIKLGIDVSGYLGYASISGTESDPYARVYGPSWDSQRPWAGFSLYTAGTGSCPDQTAAFSGGGVIYVSIPDLAGWTYHRVLLGRLFCVHQWNHARSEMTIRVRIRDLSGLNKLDLSACDGGASILQATESCALGDDDPRADTGAPMSAYDLRCRHTSLAYSGEMQGRHYVYACLGCGAPIWSDYPPRDDGRPDESKQPCPHPPDKLTLVRTEERRSQCGKLIPTQVWRCENCGQEFSLR